MERGTGVDNFIYVWNMEFPNHQLTVADLKNAHSIMSALFEILERLSIDREAVLTLPSDPDNHTVYYWDLLPVINMTRVINYLMPHWTIAPLCIMQFLQPTTITSHSILAVLFNLLLFNDDRLKYIAPQEEVLFAEKDTYKMLEDKKSKLVEMLNKQAIEKGKRSERLEKIEKDMEQFTEELKPEKEALDEIKQELEAIMKENRQTEVLCDQKRAHRDALVAKVTRERSLRVYDADDIRAQAEQATQNIQEAEEKLSSLSATLAQKENCLKNLQTTKPNLDAANNYLYEIMTLTKNIMDYKSGDLELDSKEGELDVLSTELSELRAQLGELLAARTDAADKHQQAQAKREQQAIALHSALREVPEQEKKLSEQTKYAQQRVEEIKELAAKYEEAKARDMDELMRSKEAFVTELKTFEETLLKKAAEIEKKIEEKLTK